MNLFTTICDYYKKYNTFFYLFCILEHILYIFILYTISYLWYNIIIVILNNIILNNVEEYLYKYITLIFLSLYYFDFTITLYTSKIYEYNTIYFKTRLILCVLCSIIQLILCVSTILTYILYNNISILFTLLSITSVTIHYILCTKIINIIETESNSVDPRFISEYESLTLL